MEDELTLKRKTSELPQQKLGGRKSRIVPLKVIVCGLFRTGTSSTQAALRILGLHDVYHMQSLMENNGNARLWMKAMNAKYHGKGKMTREDWDDLLGNCQAVCDVPAALFGVELAEAYPDAKILVLNRDREAWYKSCKNTVFAVKEKTTIAQLIFYLLDWGVIGQAMLCVIRMWENALGPKEFEESNVKNFFNTYYEDIRRNIPMERRLEYKVQDGWEPLCQFLGLSVPVAGNQSQMKTALAFPRINDSEAFDIMIASIEKDCRLRVYKKLLVAFSVVGNLALVWYLWARTK